MFTVHPFYMKDKLWNNIAIVHTTEPFKQAPNVNTICLPNPDIPYNDKLCSSLGWGVNSQGSDASTQDIMKQVKVNLINNTICQEKLRESGEVTYDYKVDDSFLCGEVSNSKNKNGETLCDGDGGGPVVCQEQGTNRYVFLIFFMLTIFISMITK